MRLIDADALWKKLNIWRRKLIRDYGKNDEYVLCLNKALKRIEEAPTADVPERKVGKWVLIGSRLESRPYACSKCNYAFQVDTVMGKTAWNYCPNCGADMRKETEDG